MLLKPLIHGFICSVLTINVANAGTMSDTFKQLLIRKDSGASSTHRSVYHNNRFEVMLDEHSKACIECHDGITAMEINVRGPGDAMVFLGPRSQGHPVGMHYDEYALSKPLEFRSRWSIGSSIPFEEGLVTCISCHRLKEQESSALIATRRTKGDSIDCPSTQGLNRGPGNSGLCLACHIK